MKLVLVTIGAVLATLMAGCAEPETVESEAAAEEAIVEESAIAETTVEEGVLPDFLVGTWQPSDSRWLLTLEKDGSVSRMRHFIGVKFTVAEGGVVEPWKNDGEATYFLGPCEAKYDAHTGVLSVTIDIDNYIVTMPPDGWLEGEFHDVLRGPVVPEEGVWRAEWVSTGTMYGEVENTTSVSKPMQLTFTKVSDEVYGD